MKHASFSLVCVAAINLPTFAQCGPQWLEGEQLPGLNGRANASVLWDPDGAGALPPLLVVGGKFTSAGGVQVNHIVAWDGTGWYPFGSGMSHTNQSLTVVDALAVLPNGNLVAGGIFTSVDGIPVNHIAAWNGSSWGPIGTGVTGTANDTGIRALAMMPDGNLVAGGKFTSAGGAALTINIARWDGVSWSPFVQGTNTQSTANVEALAVSPSGDLIAGGTFTTIGGVNATNIARWNGAAWSAMGTGVNSWVHAISFLPDGDVVAGGNFTIAGGVSLHNIARWDGAAWSSMNAGLDGPVESMHFAGGNLYVGGDFNAEVWGRPHRIARWNGAGWLAVGEGLNGMVYTIATLSDGRIVAAGEVSRIERTRVYNFCVWDGVTWAPPGNGVNEQVLAVAAAPNGDLIVGGSFATIGGIVANGIARWNGVSWSPFGSGVHRISNNPVSPTVTCLAIMPNGDIVAGGNFALAGETSANRVARWDGSSWYAFGSGVGSVSTDDVSALLATPSGELFVGGSFAVAGGVGANCVARWDGTAWQPLGSGLIYTADHEDVDSLALAPNGDIYAGGRFNLAGSTAVSSIARWDGANWWPLAPGIVPSTAHFYALAFLPNGDLVAGGTFTSVGSVAASRLARWNGSAWSAIDSGVQGTSVTSVAPHPGGGFVIGGAFSVAGGVSSNNIARWDGANWSSLGDGVGEGILTTAVASSAVSPTLGIAVGGNFTLAGGLPSAFFAQWTEDGAPRAGFDPGDRIVSIGTTANIEAIPARGYADIAYQWQRDGVDIVNGPGGASSGGGAVSGASGVCESPTDGTSVVLIISGAQVSDGGEYTVVFTNDCGEVVSGPGTLTVTCLADFDGDGFVTGADFDLYVQAFEVGDLTSDFDGDGFVTGLDFDAYVVAYEAGC